MVYSKNEGEHIDHLRVVLRVFKENHLFAKYNKCDLWFGLVDFLGRIISSEGVEVYPRKIEAVKNCPTPLTPTNIRSSLVLVGYYTRFMDGFSSIASLLTTLAQKSLKFE